MAPGLFSFQNWCGLWCFCCLVGCFFSVIPWTLVLLFRWVFFCLDVGTALCSTTLPLSSPAFLDWNLQCNAMEDVCCGTLLCLLSFSYLLWKHQKYLHFLGMRCWCRLMRANLQIIFWRLLWSYCQLILISPFCTQKHHYTNPLIFAW